MKDKTPINFSIGNIFTKKEKQYQVTEAEISKNMQIEFNLKERLKELNCLYGISKIIETPNLSLEKIFYRVIKLIPPSLQYPQITFCRIILDGTEYKDPKFKKTKWKLSSEIKVKGENVGVIEICLLKEMPPYDKKGFLKEERLLLNAVSERLGRVIERHRAETALIDSKERYRIIFENTPDGLFISNLKGVTIESNYAVEKLLGLKREEIIGKNFLRLGILQKGQVSKVIKLLASHMFSKSQESEVISILRKDGTKIFMEVNVHFINYLGKKHMLGIARDVTEDKRAENILRENTAKYTAMIENIGDVIAIIDSNGIIKYQSPNTEKWFGWKPEELVGKSGLANLHPDDVEMAVNDSQKDLNEETDSMLELRMKCKNGSYKWIEGKAMNRFNDPSINGMLLNYHDITERKQHQEQLRQNNEFLKLVLDSLTHPFYVINVSDYTVSIANSAALNGLQSIGMTCHALTHKRDTPCNSSEHSCPLAIIKKTKKAVTLEHIHYDEAGNLKNVEVHAHPIFDNKGNIIQVIEYSIDITERKHAEEALKQAHKNIKTILENSQFGVAIVGKDCKIRWMNKCALEMAGVDNLEIVVGQNCRDYFCPASNEECPILDKSQVVDNSERIFLRNDGKKIPIIKTVNEIVFNDESVLLETFIDITERKQAEERMKNFNAILEKLVEQRTSLLKDANKELEQSLQLNKDKDRFISILAHDLKNPFNTILGFASLLIENIRTYDDDTIEEYLNYLKDSTQSAYNLLVELLKWTQSQSGKIPFEPEKLCFSKICSEVVQVLKPNATSKNITINHQAQENVTLFADANMLKTVLRNIISNAIKFSNPEGYINLSVEMTHSDITISISDNGVGIPPERLEKLFDITQTKSTTGTADEKGTGLGLILCKDFIKKHNGEIWVESELGKGSNFKFTLPLNKMEPAQQNS